MLLQILALIVIIFIYNSQPCHSYCNHYFSQAYAFMKQPYYRLDKYQWKYGPGYYSTSELGRK